MMLPKGFLCSTVEAAIKRPGRKDLALIYSECDAALAALYTTNKVKAAPVVLDIKRSRKGTARAIVVNSGNANACTGAQGMDDAVETAALTALALGITDAGVLVSSTGVIGVPMPMARVRKAIGPLVDRLGSASLEDLARAIMTTDTFPKFISKKIKIGAKTGTVSAVAKGSGMIAPNMATMLGYVLTDLAVKAAALRPALKEAAEHTFNRVTVDGDQSTNDSIIMLANGMAGNAPVKPGSADYKKFAKTVYEVCEEMATAIARDGEGATKLVVIDVEGAFNETEAKAAALRLGNSPLVKTAIYGKDPNWGRMMSTLGSSGIRMDEARTAVYFGRVQVVKAGLSTGREADARPELDKKEVRIRITLGMGKASARVLTCDLTEGYIKINAHYTT